MDFSPEFIQALVNPDDLVTIGIVYFVIKNKFADHFGKIEDSLSKIGENILDLNKSILDLEVKQTSKIKDLSERVSQIEETIKGE